ncbi:hypothetical protein Tco_0405292 [Tanacetum coccineum]
MLLMLFFRLGVNEDVDDENNNELIKVLREILFIKSIKLNGHLSGTEGHDQERVSGPTVRKAVLDISCSITRCWLITRSRINLRKILGPLQLVITIVDFAERIAVMNRNTVVSRNHIHKAHAPSSYLTNKIGAPRRNTGSNKAILPTSPVNAPLTLSN